MKLYPMQFIFAWS